MSDKVTKTSGSALQSDNIRRAELGVFLRARRAAVLPEQAGMPRGKRRLTPGLRREEVAVLANMGVTWYTWLEQGRDINVSAKTLRQVSSALSLSASDEIYLFTLAGLPIPRDVRRADLKDPASLQGVLDGFTTGPAVMFGPTFDVLGYNRVWNFIYAIGSYRGPFARNHVYRLFMDPMRRRLYVDYEVVARHMVGLLRAQYADHVGAPEFRQLLDALTAASPEFARLWQAAGWMSTLPDTLVVWRDVENRRGRNLADDDKPRVSTPRKPEEAGLATTTWSAASSGSRSTPSTAP